MNHSFAPEQFDELCALIQALCDERITPDDRVRLEQWVCRDKEARRVYVQYMNLCASIHWDKALEPGLGHASSQGESQTPRIPLLGFLADAFQAGVSYLSHPFALSLLFTIGLPGVILLVLLASLRSQPEMELAAQPEISRPAATAAASAAPAARVTRVHQCFWAQGSEVFPDGASLPPGGQLRLSKGLVEVTFGNGARVIVEGPAAFETASATHGFLRSGSLVAHVTAEAKGFAIETPTARIVDLGTEFGVCVADEGRAADVQVFQGEVELTPAASRDNDATGHRLAAGRAVRVAMVDLEQTASIKEIAPLDNRFVRQLPPVEPAQTAIVADFSGGNGNGSPDQYPGVAGAGWEGGWTNSEAPGMRLTASVEGTNPLLGGGDYLRVLAERTSGKKYIRQGIERSLAVHEKVDLTKPYVVSFSVRIDALGRYLEKSSNQLVLCNLGQPKTKWNGARSGWHIRFDAKDYEGVKARHWCFVPNDGKDGYRRIDSGIAVREGETYSFRIQVDPAARQWMPSIAVNGGPWTAFRSMPVRSPGTAEDLGYWSKIYFYWVLQNGNQGSDVEKIGFSVDSIRITTADVK